MRACGHPSQEERLRLALERSLFGSPSPGRHHALPAPSGDSDPELRRALQASLQEENMRRCAQWPLLRRLQSI